MDVPARLFAPYGVALTVAAKSIVGYSYKVERNREGFRYAVQIRRGKMQAHSGRVTLSGHYRDYRMDMWFTSRRHGA